MAHQHEVKRGETLLSIADEYGFADWKTIWDLPANSGLRGRRADPQRLVPGDALQIPDKGERWVRVSTNQKHVFELKTPQSRLKLALEDRFGAPLARRPFKVLAHDLEIVGQTDAKGVLEVAIKASPEQSVTIELPDDDLSWQVEVGTLYPIAEEDITGAQAVLQNLGFLREKDGDACTGLMDAATGEAIGAFQKRYKLPVTKKLDGPTKARLEELTYAAE
jgi:hypothetical protein